MSDLLARLRDRLPRARRRQAPSLFDELVRIETDPAYRALFLAQLDAALDERHTAAQTAVVEEIEAAAERRRALIRSPGDRPKPPPRKRSPCCSAPP
ncbi:hypothetical protein [Streptomyces bacillaris]|uniref:hypothetical protein n=1 Tax=Streptomyces bacillaris TaxID=68179 RepID=UPI00346068DC